jgi:predicted acyltransferase
MNTPVSVSLNNDAAQASSDARPKRMLSVDALRGFDMFWIIGGEEVAKALEALGGGWLLTAVSQQLKHVEWAGFRFYDGIFPLFLFLVGVSITLSMDRMLASAGRRGALARIARRSVLLFAVGVFYYGGFSRAWPDVQVSGVLPRIALCYFVAATLYVFLPWKGLVAAAVLFLAGYWALLTFAPFPDVSLAHGTVGKKGSQTEAKTPPALLAGEVAMVSGVFEEGRNFTHYVDYRWLPGKKRNLYYSNEGLLSTMSAVVTTLFGIMAGWLLTSTRWTEKQKAAWLLGAGTAALGMGFLWGLQMPVIKRIWSPSFCLVSGGFSAVMLGAFYLVVDVWRWQKWCTPLLWIGANALAVYLAVNLLDFNAIAVRLAGGDVQAFLDSRIGQGVGGVLIAGIGLLLPVMFVRFLHRQKIFIRL